MSIKISGRPTTNITAKQVTKRDGTTGVVAAFTVAVNYGSDAYGNKGVNYYDAELWGDEALKFDGATTRDVIDLDAAGVEVKPWIGRDGKARANKILVGLRTATLRRWNGTKYAAVCMYTATRRAVAEPATQATAERGNSALAEAAMSSVQAATKRTRKTA